VTVPLLCPTSILQPVWLRRPYLEYKTPASTAIRVIEFTNYFFGRRYI